MEGVGIVFRTSLRGVQFFVKDNDSALVSASILEVSAFRIPHASADDTRLRSFRLSLHRHALRL